MPFRWCLSCCQYSPNGDHHFQPTLLPPGGKHSGPVQQLDLSRRALNDVPTDIFNYERSLEHLCLDSNNIRDLPRQLFHCHELRQLRLADNDLHVLPAAVSSLEALEVLDVSKNVLTDLPDSMKQCRLLSVLDTSINPLQKVPEVCTQLLSITELYLNDTFLEFLPANFGRLTKLKILELRENRLSSLPKSLSRLVHLQRLDLGQNELAEVPEPVGWLVQLQELWVDGNRIRVLPDWLGNLGQLSHLDASLNHIDQVSERLGLCGALQDLTLSTNNLRSLPEAIGNLQSLVTLRIDDNQLEQLPMSLGKLSNLEELICGQNCLRSLPASIGLCRRLHTFNVDDNDLEVLPSELGSCTSLRILSAHNNRLNTLPAELDHITKLAVINVTANKIQHLPLSFTRLTSLHALWLSQNQHKPLVQLGQDTDPETGRKVLTNFLLPQMELCPQSPGSSSSSSSSSLLSCKKSHVQWAAAAGQQHHDHETNGAGSSGMLRREPTPFPKEMRAMAKRLQSMRSDQLEQSESPADVIQRRKSQEYRPRDQRKASLSQPDVVAVIKQARVTKSGTADQPPTEEQPHLSATEDTRDSGVITPSDEAPDFSMDSSQSRYYADPLPQKPVQNVTCNISRPSSSSSPPSSGRSLDTIASSIQTVIRRADPGAADGLADLELHALQLRKVSEQMLISHPRSRSSFSSKGSPAAPFHMPSGDIRLRLPSSGPHHTVGLPSVVSGRAAANGLLSTIEKAAHSDEELRQGHQPHCPSSSTSPTPPPLSSRVQSRLPVSAAVVSSFSTYENVAAATASSAATMQSNNNNTIKTMSTSQFVHSSPVSASRLEAAQTRLTQGRRADAGGGPSAK